MSELSPVYSEYERISSLFRRLNEAILLAHQAALGLKVPSEKEQSKVLLALDSALSELGEKEVTASTLTFAEILSQLKEQDVDVSDAALDSIRGRVKRGLKGLTAQDLEVIEKVTDVLDSKSEFLFRRIQK
jgi:hypothetical protein